MGALGGAAGDEWPVLVAQLRGRLLRALPCSGFHAWCAARGTTAVARPRCGAQYPAASAGLASGGRLARLSCAEPVTVGPSGMGDGRCAGPALRGGAHAGLPG